MPSKQTKSRKGKGTGKKKTKLGNYWERKYRKLLKKFRFVINNNNITMPREEKGEEEAAAVVPGVVVAMLLILHLIHIYLLALHMQGHHQQQQQYYHLALKQKLPHLVLNATRRTR